METQGKYLRKMGIYLKGGPRFTEDHRVKEHVELHVKSHINHQSTDGNVL
jgi:hypothetical protein